MYIFLSFHISLIINLGNDYLKSHIHIKNSNNKTCIKRKLLTKLPRLPGEQSLNRGRIAIFSNDYLVCKVFPISSDISIAKVRHSVLFV